MHLCPGEEFPQAFPVPVAAQGSEAGVGAEAEAEAEAGVAGRHFAVVIVVEPVRL